MEFPKATADGLAITLATCVGASAPARGAAVGRPPARVRRSQPKGKLPSAFALRLRKGVAATAILAVMLPGSASACGYDAQIGGGISMAHAASVPVAMAVGDAVSAGRLSLLAEVPPPLALIRANGAMRTLAAMLEPGVGTLPPVALVLIEAHLWGRITSEPGETRFEPHVAGPAAGDVVLVTAEPALKALLDGRITWEFALAAGLVVVDGPSEGRDRLARFLSRQNA